MPRTATVLVVDDDAVNRRPLEHSLKVDGFNVVTAGFLIPPFSASP